MKKKGMMMMIMNKKGKKLMEDVEREWAKEKDRHEQIRHEELNLRDYGEKAKGFLEQITGNSSGVAQRDVMGFQKKKMSNFMQKRGIFQSDITATAEQIALRKKREAKAKNTEKKRVEKRQRGSKTLRKRKMEVPEYLQKMEDLKKYKKGFKILLEYYLNDNYLEREFGASRAYSELRLLGLIR